MLPEKIQKSAGIANIEKICTMLTGRIHDYQGIRRVTYGGSEVWTTAVMTKRSECPSLPILRQIYF